jgi:hypothetical protein
MCVSIDVCVCLCVCVYVSSGFCVNANLDGVYLFSARQVKDIAFRARGLSLAEVADK